MDDTTPDVGETDEFARLLSQLNAPTTDPVASPAAAVPPTTPGPDTAPAFGFARPIPETPPVPSTVDATFPDPPRVASRAPELMGADELAAPPRPFPPRQVDAPPLVAPPVPPYATKTSPSPAEPDPSWPPAQGLVAQAVVVPSAAVAPPAQAPAPSIIPTGAPPGPPQTPPPSMRGAPVEFAALLAPSSDGAESARLTFASGTEVDDEPDIAKSTVGEKIILVLAILLPPIGLIAAVVASIGSARRRGWVIGLLKAAIAIGVVLSVILGIGGSYGYTVLQQQLAHDRTAAASAAFCSTLTTNPTMRQLPTFGWPAVAASIPDSLVTMQAYEDRWTKLAEVSPAGIEPEVAKVASEAKRIVDSVTVGRTIDDASNISAISATASASGIPAWYAEYCK